MYKIGHGRSEIGEEDVSGQQGWVRESRRQGVQHTRRQCLERPGHEQYYYGPVLVSDIPDFDPSKHFSRFVWPDHGAKIRRVVTSNRPIVS